MTRDRGGPVEGERSISGRACLPLLLAMITAATLLGWFGVAMAVAS